MIHRLMLVALMAGLAACAAQPSNEIAAVPSAAPLPRAERMVLDQGMRASFRDQCLDAARAKQSEAVAARYCGCVLETAQVYVPADEWRDAVLPGRNTTSRTLGEPIGPTFAKVASGCGALVLGQ